MLKDPFVPSRTAALRSIGGTLDYYTPQQLAELLFPAVCPCSVDVHSEVREAAITLMSEMTQRLTANHKEMPSVGPDGQPLGSPQTPATSLSASKADATAAAGGSWGAIGGFFGSGSAPASGPKPSTETPAKPSTASSYTPSPATPTPAPVPKPTATTINKPSTQASPPPAATSTKTNGGWGDVDDDNMFESAWGKPTTAPPQAAAITTPVVKKATPQAQMDDFFGPTTNSLNNTVNSLTSPTTTGTSGSTAAMTLRPIRSVGGGTGGKKLGLGLGGGASKVE
eukprot:GDKK01044794.1.p1 GENE.GDKK01044794.1~~GDKK01044794.1.p1  ORF type:complete len:283 (+),score=18.42 GDKK01044794.1:3-851(+)